VLLEHALWQVLVQLSLVLFRRSGMIAPCVAISTSRSKSAGAGVRVVSMAVSLPKDNGG
jgi:hypothetical protein